MSATALSTISVAGSFSLEECPYETVVVDVTHKCNMACNNCYIPNRSIPDLDAKWLDEVFGRLPRGRKIRLVGAEPTMREDLPQLITNVRRHRHHPAVLSNGLKLADRNYVRQLKQAGLRVIYLSFNGGFDDEAYVQIDSARCAALKVKALENLCAENMYVSLGMILVRGVNEHLVRDVWDYVRSHRQIREFHLRSIGQFGRYMEVPPLTMDELVEIVSRGCSLPRELFTAQIEAGEVDLRVAHTRVQITVWPDLGNYKRGRLTPEGRVELAFEHGIANEGGY